MKIVIAAWHLRDRNVGLGRYCRGLIEGLGRVDRENRYVILMPDDRTRFPEHANFRYRVIRIPVFKRRLWEQLAPLLVGPHDLLHFPYDSCVVWKRAKFVATIHDIKPLLFPALAPKRTGPNLVHAWLVGDKWVHLDHVVTDSLCSKRDLVRHLKLPEDRITVVYPGVDLERFRPALLPEASRPASRPSRGVPNPLATQAGPIPGPYLLCVAGADPTKNVETVIEAFGRLPAALRDTHRLVLAGDVRKRRDLYEWVARWGLTRQTVWTGVVSDEQLITLYQRAAAFVFPSRYEGFGLPVLEAMACGCPVISSHAASLPEVVGEAALLVDPEDVHGWATAIEQVLTDPAVASELRARGLARAAQFSWDRTAREMVAVYEKVVHG